MYIYICVCICIQIHTSKLCLYTYKYKHRSWRSTHSFVATETPSKRFRWSIYVYVYIHVYIDVYIYVYIWIWTYTCVYVYINIWIFAKHQIQVSHVTHVDESCNIWISHVIYGCVMTCMNKSPCTQTIQLSHVTHVDEPCHIWIRRVTFKMRNMSYECVTSRAENAGLSFHMCGWVMSHMWTTVDPMSLKDTITRNQTNHEFVPKYCLKIAECNHLYYWELGVEYQQSPYISRSSFLNRLM